MLLKFHKKSKDKFKESYSDFRDNKENKKINLQKQRKTKERTKYFWLSNYLE